MVLFERSELSRKDQDVTSVAGYIGGTRTGNHSQVCHYNAAHTAEYSTFGYAEAVSLKLPSASVGLAARRFFEDGFVEIAPGIWAREDVHDMGSAYRAIIALPGGYDSPLLEQIRAANVHNMTLLPGNASNATDTFGTSSVWVLDSDELAFHQAELCLQFHDPQGATFPASYHALEKVLVDQGRLAPTPHCPTPYDCGGSGRQRAGGTRARASSEA